MSATPGERTCVWEENWDGNFETECGQTFVLNYGTPADNRMKFCCYCGGRLMKRVCTWYTAKPLPWWG